MHVINGFILVILLIKYVAPIDWGVKTKLKVRVSNILHTEKDISLLTCQIKCNLNQDCYEIGTDENVDLGMTGGCYLLRKNDQSDSSKTISNPSIVTKEMFVYHKHDLCKASRCRSDQNCEVTGARYTCVCKNGLNTDDCKHPLSCDAIKKSNQNAQSGFYTINPSKPVSVYCDMDMDKNGWMLIANITLPNPISSADARKLSSFQSLSNDIGQLSQVITGRFKFNPVHLANFDASFKFLHFYCKKPGGRTVSFSTISNNILDYFMLKTDSKPAACSSFERLSEDNSRLGVQCKNWWLKTWGGLSTNGNRLYEFPFYVGYKYHYGISGTRYECDDYLGTNAGVWRIYVR